MRNTDDQHSGYVEVAGARLFWRDDGPLDAPVLLCSNSLGTDLRMWDPQHVPFTQQYRVLRYDNRGHGRSDAPAGPYTLDQLGGDVLAILDALKIERAHICGLSLGGVVAQWLATRHPERVRRIVLANTAARIGTQATWNERIAAVRAGGMAAIHDAAVARFLSAPFRTAHPTATSQISQMLLASSPEGYIAACAALRDADLRADSAAIRSPTLIIGSTEDVSTPLAQARELHATIPGSQLVVLEAAHLSNVERASEFTQAVLAFLSES